MNKLPPSDGIMRPPNERGFAPWHGHPAWLTRGVKATVRISFPCFIGLPLVSLLGMAPARSGRVAVNISYEMAQPIIESLDDDLPAELKNRSPAELEAAWPVWVARHDHELSARLTRGEEDTLVNFLTFGSSFTLQPRLAAVDFARLPLDQFPSELSSDTPPETAVFFKRV